ncbi:galactan 1,3-beta-galactosidase [Tothia fuscella]|uniref:Galactan 1,3-beta-galactosidase n=1 Tax=Tothia fuscella TaxID=1048955 RepID=A0A9P4U2C7_9PEZI|nr:galactan 1,3-beta-galactosidase [Tothia fuscella]
MHKLRLFGLIVVFFSHSIVSSLEIVSGATWTATNTGKHVQSHGAGIINVDNVFYMIGEDKSDGPRNVVNCYSSSNLVEWNLEGAPLRMQGGDLGPGRVVERPKVIYNKSTRKYVMYMHIDSGDYKEAKVGVATCDSVCGIYTYHKSFQPMGKQSRDMGLYQDDDGTAYLLSEDRQNGLHIFKLAKDYLSVSSMVYTWPEKFEAPAILKKDGTYFMFASRLSGWDANDNIYSTASSLYGPWTLWQLFAPQGSKTFTSQTTYILTVGRDTAIYAGDRWVGKNLMRSTYVWLPLRISGKKASLENHPHWSVDITTGSLTLGGKQELSYGAHTATASGGARLVDCSGCSGKKSIGYIGGPSNGTIIFNSVKTSVAGRRTLVIKYTNGDKTQRFAEISVNGSPGQTVAFLPSSDDATPASSVAHLNLKEGINNIKISAKDQSWGPNIDRLVVFDK